MVDHQSSNGTFVNEQRIQTADLKNGDLIRAGHSSFLVQFGQPDYVSSVLGKCPGPRSDRSWELVEGSGFKRGSNSILFADDKAHSAWPTEQYIEQQRQIILGRIPGSQVSAIEQNTLPKAGAASLLNIQFQTKANGPTVVQRQFYIRNAEQISILTVTLLESEQAALQNEVDHMLAAVECKHT